MVLEGVVTLPLFTVIDNLAGLARSSDKQRASDAAKQLQVIVEQAQLPAMQKAAQVALDSVKTADVTARKDVAK